MWRFQCRNIIWEHHTPAQMLITAIAHRGLFNNKLPPHLRLIPCTEPHEIEFVPECSVPNCNRKRIDETTLEQDLRFIDLDFDLPSWLDDRSHLDGDD